MKSLNMIFDNDYEQHTNKHSSKFRRKMGFVTQDVNNVKYMGAM